MKKKNKWIGRLPDTTITTSKSLYIKTWRACAAPVGKAINGKLFAFDPGFSYCVGSQTIDLPASIVIKLNKCLIDPTIKPLKLERCGPKYEYDPRSGYMRTEEEILRARSIEDAAVRRENAARRERTRK